MNVGGRAGSRFGPVREIFAQVIAGQSGTGAPVAAWWDGAWVVDLWGGPANAAGTRLWRPTSWCSPTRSRSRSRPCAPCCWPIAASSIWMPRCSATGRSSVPTPTCGRCSAGCLRPRGGQRPGVADGAGARRQRARDRPRRRWPVRGPAAGRAPLAGSARRGHHGAVLGCGCGVDAVFGHDNAWGLGFGVDADGFGMGGREAAMREPVPAAGTRSAS